MALLDIVDAVNREDLYEITKKPDDARHVLPLAERIMRRVLHHKTIYEHSACVSSALTSGLLAIKRHGADDRSRCVRSFINTVAKVVDIAAWLEEPRAATMVQQACSIMDTMEHAINGTVRMIAYFASEGHGEFFMHRVVPPLMKTFRKLGGVKGGKYVKEFKATVEHTTKVLRDSGTPDSLVLSRMLMKLVTDAMNDKLSDVPYGRPFVGCSYQFCRTVSDASEDKMMARIRKTCCSCRQANYCSEVCQKAHWGVHKERCMDPFALNEMAFVLHRIIEDAAAREKKGDGQEGEGSYGEISWEVCSCEEGSSEEESERGEEASSSRLTWKDLIPHLCTP